MRMFLPLSLCSNSMARSLAVFVLWVYSSALVSQAEENTLIFESDLRPLFAKKCSKCHSAKVHKGGLDLSTMATLRRGGESGEDLVAESIDALSLFSSTAGIASFRLALNCFKTAGTAAARLLKSRP